jgi:mRNA interferase MazF
VIIQNDVGNQHSALTIVVAVTSNLRAASLPVGVLLNAGEGGLAQDSVAHCGHIYSVDKKRLGKRLGQLTLARMVDVDRALACSIGL